MRLWLLTGLVCVMSTAQAATTTLHGSQYFKEITEEVLQTLPANYLSSVSKQISLKEEPYKTDNLLIKEDLCKLDQQVKFGTTKKYNITISSGLVNLARKIRTLLIADMEHSEIC